MGLANPYLANAVNQYVGLQQQQQLQEQQTQRELAMAAAKHQLDLDYQDKLMTMSEQHQRGMQQETLAHQAVANVDRGRATQTLIDKYGAKELEGLPGYYNSLGTSTPDDTVVNSIIRRRETATSPAEIRAKKEQQNADNLNKAGFDLFNSPEYNADSLQDPQMRLKAEQTLAQKYNLSLPARKMLRDDIEHIGTIKNMPEELKPVATQHLKDIATLHSEQAKGTLSTFLQDPSSETFISDYNNAAQLLNQNWNKAHPKQKDPYPQIEVVPKKGGVLGFGGTPTSIKNKPAETTVTLADLPATAATRKRYDELKKQGKTDTQIAQIISDELGGKK